MLQLLAAIAALTLCVLSLTTSRRRRARQQRLMLLSVLLMVLSLLGTVTTLVLAADPEDADYWLALATPCVTLIVGALTVWRATRLPPVPPAGRPRIQVPPAAKSR